MAVRNVEMAHSQLGPYFEDFVTALDAGIQYFWKNFADDAHRFTKICRANMVRCLVADELKKLVDGRPGVIIIEAHETTTILFGPDWMLRVHKIDEDGQTAPNDTQTYLDMNDNDVNALPGIPDSATVVYLGYIEIVGDRLNPEARLVCPDGDKPAWIIDLRAGLVSPPAPIESTGGGDDGGTRVVVKRQDRKASH